MMTLPMIPQTTPVSTFCAAFHIFILGEHRAFKFGRQVDHSKSQPMDDKPSQKLEWSHFVTHFKFLTPPQISLERLKQETSDFVHWLAMWSICLRIDKSLKWAWLRSCDLFKYWEI